MKCWLFVDHSGHFQVHKNFTTIQIDVMLKTPLPAHILATRQLLNLTLQASALEESGLNDTLSMLIVLPIKGISKNKLKVFFVRVRDFDITVHVLNL